MAVLNRGAQRRGRIRDTITGRGPHERVQRCRGVAEAEGRPAEQIGDHGRASPGVVAPRARHAGKAVRLGEFGLARGKQRPGIRA